MDLVFVNFLEVVGRKDKLGVDWFDKSEDLEVVCFVWVVNGKIYGIDLLVRLWVGDNDVVVIKEFRYFDLGILLFI